MGLGGKLMGQKQQPQTNKYIYISIILGYIINLKSKMTGWLYVRENQLKS